MNKVSTEIARILFRGKHPMLLENINKKVTTTQYPSRVRLVVEEMLSRNEVEYMHGVSHLQSYGYVLTDAGKKKYIKK